MSGYTEAAHRQAAERLVRFAKRDHVAALIDKLRPWTKSEHGAAQWIQLALLADSLLSGEISMGQYQAHLEVMEAVNKLPQSEFKIIARWALEFTRCNFIGHGHDLIVDVEENVEGGDE